MQVDLSVVSEPPAQEWGDYWTEKKTDIVVDYAKAYLSIMKERKYWKLLYFDGFAGEVPSEENIGNNENMHLSAAIRILNIESPRPFDIYYFVELNPKKAESLENHLKKYYPKKSAFVSQDDCNKKLIDLSKYLKYEDGKNAKVLAFVDPFGMQVKWESIEALRDLSIDLWILVPTGIGVNRLLKRDGNISEAWMKKLTTFLGMKESEIRNHFYKVKSENTLFGTETQTVKESDVIHKAGELYKDRLKTVFKLVSNPFVIENSTGSVMFHFFMASNNATAFKIANDIIKLKGK